MSYQSGSVLALMCAACGSVGAVTDAPLPIDAPGSSDGPTIDAMEPDALIPIDAPMSQMRCDPNKPFGTPTLVSSLSSSIDDVSFALTSDELTGFLGRTSPTVSPTILVMRRASNTAAFGAPEAAITAAINDTPGAERVPSTVANGRVLYFHRQPPSGVIAVLAASRADDNAAFGAGSPVFIDIETLDNTLSPTISADGQTLYWLDFMDFGKVFAATRGGSPNQFFDKRAASSIAISGRPVLSADELTLYYATGNGVDVLVTTRASKAALFGTGLPVPNVNSTENDQPLELSRDGCVLYLSSSRPGGAGGDDIWEARRPL